MTPHQSSAWLRETLAPVPMIPVLTVDHSDSAEPLADALCRGGLNVLEVTLRTHNALRVIDAMSSHPGVVVGAGTLLKPEHAVEAKGAGAAFGVSPGSTPALIAACQDIGLPLLPGAVTATEAMRLLDQGFDLLKFFPAEPSGGVAALKALTGPLPHARFCPTGGISRRKRENLSGSGQRSVRRRPPGSLPPPRFQAETGKTSEERRVARRLWDQL